MKLLIEKKKNDVTSCKICVSVCVCMYLIFFSIFHIFLKILFFLPKEPNPWENERDPKWVMKFIFYFSLMVLKPDCTLVFHGEL